MAGAACGIAGAGRAAAAGGPPRPPPWGGSASAAVVERARTETAAIAARRKCNDITKLRNETFKLKCACNRRVPGPDCEKSPRMAAVGPNPAAPSPAHENVINPRLQVEKSGPESRE
jgi:hypothetical protein